jgi:membrane associated rhomboid family serine protease
VLTPLGLDVPYDRLPGATMALIGLMACLLFVSLSAGPDSLEDLRLHRERFEAPQLVTHALVHHHPWHLLMNALFLWVFGRYVEHRLGGARFLVLFLLFAAAGALVWLWKGTGQQAVGASGAVSGMLGVVFCTAPKAGLSVSLGIWPKAPWHPPAWLLLIGWVALDLMWAHATEGRGGHVAHLGGFLAGVLTTWVLRTVPPRGSGWYLPRHRHDGETHSQEFQELLESEASWRAIDEHLRKRGRDGRHRVGAVLVPLLITSVALGACAAPRRVAPCEPTCAAREGDVQEFTALVDDLTRIGSHGAIDPRRAGR